MTDQYPTYIHLEPGGRLSGAVQIPGDKSVSHRALMLGSIAEGETSINGFLDGEDTLATLACLESMGVEISRPGAHQVKIKGKGLNGLATPSSKLDCGNSGTSARLLTGLLAGQVFNSEIIGDNSLMQRPMIRIVEPLLKMGATISTSKSGTLPVHIKGGQKLKGIDYTLPVASAQLKSCLLLAGLYAQGKTIIHEPVLTRDHTERMLTEFGCRIDKKDREICIVPGNELRATTINVPADISSAAFFMVGACIAEGSEIILGNVGVNPTRNAVITILQKMGADISVVNEKIISGEPVADIQIKSSKLHGINIPLDQVPVAIDELPAVMIAATCAEGTTTLHGAEELRIKESDRIATMTEGLLTLGIEVESFADGMSVKGGPVKGGIIDSYGDHRIAMSFAMTALVAREEITIQHCENISTSFPGFVECALNAGLKIK